MLMSEQFSSFRSTYAGCVRHAANRALARSRAPILEKVKLRNSLAVRMHARRTTYGKGVINVEMPARSTVAPSALNIMLYTSDGRKVGTRLQSCPQRTIRSQGKCRDTCWWVRILQYVKTDLKRDKFRIQKE